MRALRPPLAASPVTYLFRFRCPRDSSTLRARRCQRSRAGGGPASGQDHWSAGDPIAGVLSRGREWDISGLQATHPVPLPRSKTCSKTPAGPTRPRQYGLVSAAPAADKTEAPACHNIEATARLWHLLSTLHGGCCHCPCRLASGWLARLYREGVEPSG